MAKVGPPDEKGRARPVYFPRTIGPEDKAGAWDYFNRIRTEATERAVESADPTVEALITLYNRWAFGQVGAGKLAEAHRRARMTHLGKIAFHAAGRGNIGAKRAADLTTAEVEHFVEAMLAAGYSRHYVAGMVRSIKAVYGWACRPVPGRTPERILAANPLAGYRVLGTPHAPERFAEAAEAAEFLRHFRRYAARNDRRSLTARFDRLAILMVRVLIRTGARPKELCDLTWKDLRWDAGRTDVGQPYGKLVLPPERHKRGKSTGKPRTIYLTPILTRALTRERDRPARHPEFVFTHRLGRGAKGKGARPEAGVPWNSDALAKKVKKVRRLAIRAGADMEDEGENRLVNYRWRHTAASKLIMMGFDLPSIAELLGTSEEMLRKHYGHLLDSHIARAAEALAFSRRRPRSTP